MEKITELSAAASLLSELQPGSVVIVEGYVNSKGVVSDRMLTLLEPDGYARMLEDSRRILRDWDRSKPEHLTFQDPEAAVESLVTALERRGSNTAPARASYEHVKGSVYTLNGPVTEQFYLLRCAEHGAPVADLTALKPVNAMGEFLNLPHLGYVHVVKFTNQSFKSVYVEEVA
jgi:hypothetical protein